MANMNIFGKDWMDLIFKGRNKQYGAYELRQKSSRNTLLALILGVFFIGLAFGSKVLYDQFGADLFAKKDPDDQGITAIEIELPIEEPEPPVEEVEEPEPEPEPEPADAQKNVQDEKQFTETEVKKDEEVDKSKEQKTSQEDFDDNTTSGRENSEGDKDKGALKSDGKQTGKAEEASEGLGTGDQASDNKIYRFVQQKADPMNGMENFRRDFSRKFRTPDVPSNVKQVSIKLRFVVEKDGSLTDIKALDNKYGVGDEAIRVLKSMPKWKPAMQGGNVVRSSFTWTITLAVN